MYKKKQKYIIPFLIGLFLFIQSRHFLFWPFFEDRILNGMIAISVPLLCALRIKFTKTNSKSYFFGFLFVLICIRFCFDSELLGYVTTGSLVFLLFLNPEDREVSYRVFYNIVAIAILLSIVNLILVILGILGPIDHVPPLNEVKQYGYYVFHFFVQEDLFELDWQVRFCSGWDEAGTLGTLAGVILMIEHVNLKKWQNIIILIAGLLSYSFYFYLILLIYLGFRLFNQKRLSVKLLIIGVFVTFAVLSSQKGTFFYDMIGSRLQYDSKTGSLAGDSRAGEDLKKYFNSISWTTPEFYFGVGHFNKSIISKYSASAGIRNFIITYGFLSLFLYFFFFFIYGRQRARIKKDFYIWYFIMFLSYYQRPSEIDSLYVFLFTYWLYRISFDFFPEKENKSTIKSRRIDSANFLPSN